MQSSEAKCSLLSLLSFKYSSRNDCSGMKQYKTKHKAKHVNFFVLSGTAFPKSVKQVKKNASLEICLPDGGYYLWTDVISWSLISIPWWVINSHICTTYRSIGPDMVWSVWHPLSDVHIILEHILTAILHFNHKASQSCIWCIWTTLRVYGLVIYGVNIFLSTLNNYYSSCPHLTIN